MPRDGSPRPAGGATPLMPMSIGEVADPPFAVLPSPSEIYDRRQKRFETLAPGHQLEPYLKFLAALCGAQHHVQEELRSPALPTAERLEAAYSNAMPPLSIGSVDFGDDFDVCFTSLLSALQAANNTPQTQAAIDKAISLDAHGRRALANALLLDEIPTDDVAVHILAAAAVQVYYSKMAAQLDASRLQRVSDSACPACGGAPVASSIVGWEGAHGTRFCSCSICATQWNVVRIKCLMCGSEKGIGYHSLEGSSGTVSGETCESCKSYVKMLHQHKDPALDPLADDVASLALDLTLQREGWKRASANPFLAGY
ncbi:MAG TPA: formate dehydrogenase accessory protein FdhE [Hyphomicrobiaceae bacterium]|nr:formate dehydrogenase accessory protein FdhE [Hyphomicrobiaceae bacterium]